MVKRKIIRNKGTDTCIEYLDMLNDADEYDEKHNATTEELADLCDQDAESCNNHFAVGTHRLLAVLLCNKVGDDYANKIILEIAEYGGLDGMNGCGGKPPVYKDLGINPPWDVWRHEHPNDV